MHVEWIDVCEDNAETFAPIPSACGLLRPVSAKSEQWGV